MFRLVEQIDTKYGWPAGFIAFASMNAEERVLLMALFAVASTVRFSAQNVGTDRKLKGLGCGQIERTERAI